MFFDHRVGPYGGSSITYGNDTFIVVGGGGYMFYSKDGFSWNYNSNSHGTQDRLLSVKYFKF